MLVTRWICTPGQLSFWNKEISQSEDGVSCEPLKNENMDGSGTRGMGSETAGLDSGKYLLYPKKCEVWWVMLLWDRGEKNLDDWSRSKKMYLCAEGEGYHVKQEWCRLFHFLALSVSSCESSYVSLGEKKKKTFSGWDSLFPCVPFLLFLKGFWILLRYQLVQILPVTIFIGIIIFVIKNYASTWAGTNVEWMQAMWRI